MFMIEQKGIYRFLGVTTPQALREVPQLAEELEAELTFSLKSYGEHLAAIGQSRNALWVYTQVEQTRGGRGGGETQTCVVYRSQ